MYQCLNDAMCMDDTQGGSLCTCMLRMHFHTSMTTSYAIQHSPGRALESACMAADTCAGGAGGITSRCCPGHSWQHVGGNILMAILADPLIRSASGGASDGSSMF